MAVVTCRQGNKVALVLGETEADLIDVWAVRNNLTVSQAIEDVWELGLGTAQQTIEKGAHVNGHNREESA